MIYDDIGYFSPAGFQITGNVQKPVKIPEKNMFTIWATRPVNIRAQSKTIPIGEWASGYHIPACRCLMVLLTMFKLCCGCQVSWENCQLAASNWHTW